MPAIDFHFNLGRMDPKQLQTVLSQKFPLHLSPEHELHVTGDCVEVDGSLRATLQLISFEPPKVGERIIRDIKEQECILVPSSYRNEDDRVKAYLTAWTAALPTLCKHYDLDTYLPYDLTAPEVLSVDTFVAALKSPDILRRLREQKERRALLELFSDLPVIADEKRELLVHALAENFDTCWSALEKIRTSGDKSLVPHLQRIVEYYAENEEEWSCDSAAFALYTLGGAATLPFLLPLVGCNSFGKFHQTIGIGLELDKASSLELARKLLASSKDSDRASGAWALAWLWEPSTTELITSLLIKAMSDENLQVRRNAFWSGEAAPNASEALTAALKAAKVD